MNTTSLSRDYDTLSPFLGLRGFTQLHKVTLLWMLRHFQRYLCPKNCSLMQQNISLYLHKSKSMYTWRIIDFFIFVYKNNLKVGVNHENYIFM